MKKILLIVASVVLLFPGCTKEMTASLDGGGSFSVATIDFRVRVTSSAATKAVIDGDGDGANVNRCIMEIYNGDELYRRIRQSVSGSSVTFANVPVVVGRTYRILFWADHGDALADKYYSTASSLKSVKVDGDAFVRAMENGRNDELDAFFLCEDYTVPKYGGVYTAVLRRPFAQLNVITTDVGEGNAVASESLLPEKIIMQYKAPNTLNVATGELSGEWEYCYEAPVYGSWSTVSSAHRELTMTMDYIFVAADKTDIDVTLKTVNGGEQVMSHNLTNLPCRRNYRTNVRGALLSTEGNWVATIDPAWTATENFEFYD